MVWVATSTSFVNLAATLAIASGTDLRTISGRLGHADPSVTLRVYADAVEARDRELAGLLGAAVLGSPSDGTIGQESEQSLNLGPAI